MTAFPLLPMRSPRATLAIPNIDTAADITID